MVSVFLKLLNMSLTASWIVLAVVAFRVLFPKAPKWINCLLWGIVGLRLLVPVALESSLSLIPSAEIFPQDIAVSATPAIDSGISVVNNTVNPLLTFQFLSDAAFMQKLLTAAAVVWLAGTALMLAYSAFTYLRLSWRVRASLRIQENIYVCDAVVSPFVMGVLRPRIYLPSGMEENALQYVLAHEKAHIQRRDHWWKPLGFVLLAIHWFNPLMWLSYILLCRDIEQACDEKVVSAMDVADKKGYSMALVSCSVHRRMVLACPLAFGELSVKSRIKGVLSYKKPAFWVILVSVVSCAVAAVCFLTNPLPCFHDYSSEVTMAATCTQRGVERRTCSLCEHSYTATVPMLEHSYDAGRMTAEPTCTATGVWTCTCVDCGKERTEKIPRTDHVAGGPMELTAANCTDLGKKKATCIYCQRSFIAEILQPNDVHDMHETVLRAASCTEPGEGVHTCSRCGQEEGCTYEATGHHFVLAESYAATCNSYGYNHYCCTICGEVSVEQLPMGNHNFVYWNSQYKQCSHCGMRVSSTPTQLFPDPTKTQTPDTLFPVIRIWP